MPKEKNLQPPLHQEKRPGREHKMKPRPKAEDEKTGAVENYETRLR
jgi:hypothetical protein